MTNPIGSAPVSGRGANVQSDEAANPPKFTVSRSRITLTPTAERWISEWACALVSGEVQFWQLPDSLREFFVYAFEDGRQSAHCFECDRLRWERDLYYWLFANPGKNGSDFYRHLTSELWREAAS